MSDSDLRSSSQSSKTVWTAKIPAGSAVRRATPLPKSWRNGAPSPLRMCGSLPARAGTSTFTAPIKAMAALAADADVQVIRLAPVGKMPTLPPLAPRFLFCHGVHPSGKGA